MRQFFLEFQGHEKLQPLVRETAWAHNLRCLVAVELKNSLQGKEPHDCRKRPERRPQADWRRDV
jgi:hypothetical protein